MAVRVLDTNIVSYLMKSHSLADAYSPHLEGHTLAISFMTVGELYEGAYRAQWGRRKLARLASSLRGYVVIPSSPEICRCWGRVRADRAMQPISIDDAWIAATAIVHSCSLVTHNPHDFHGIDGLDIITHQQP
ncbi:MAG: type II toxin-antitoxin system VapC family toxin [Planctomycetes bacterium]|nr:type II toxin-antitoxin system VapC family toxin [Planctomycetota bacterium]